MNILDNLSRRINLCSEEVDNRNRSSLVLFAQGAFFLAIIVIGMSLFLPYYHSLLVPHVTLFIYTAVLYIVARYFQKTKFKYIRAVQYLVFAPLLLGGVLVGTVFDPNRPGVTIILFLCILPLFMIDNPWKIIGYQLSFAALFVIFAYHYKPHDILVSDMLYFPVYLAYIIGVNIYSLMEKITGVEDYLLARKEAEKDPLTGLLNHASGEIKVNRLLQEHTTGSFAILDIDNFKMFNDQYGHQLGDQVLCELARSLQFTFRPSDVLWRLGGDEFAIFAIGMVDANICQRKFDELTQLLEDVNFPQAASLHIGISVGCTIYSGKSIDFASLYKISDEALYEAKASGKGKIILRNM